MDDVDSVQGKCCVVDVVWVMLRVEGWYCVRVRVCECVVDYWIEDDD